MEENRMYVFDTNAFSQLFRSYYPSRFPTLWEYFDELINSNKITSTKEVAREIEDGSVELLRKWAKNHKSIFPTPSYQEAQFVTKIFSVSHFRQIIEKRKILKGGKNADPFIVARGAILNATVVTMESEPKNGAKIPNICRHFNIKFTNLEGFMEMEGWVF